MSILPVHDSRDPHSDAGNNPTRADGCFGDLHWDIAYLWLNHRLKRR